MASDDDICPACDQPVQLREPSYPPRVTRCLCNGADLRAEIERLRADLGLVCAALGDAAGTVKVHDLDHPRVQGWFDLIRRVLGEADDE